MCEERVLLRSSRGGVFGCGFTIRRKQWAFQGIKNVRHGQLRGLSTQHISPLGSALARDDAGLLHRVKYLLEEAGRNRLAFRNRFCADGVLGVMKRKVDRSNDPVSGSQAHFHFRLFRWGFFTVYTLRPPFMSRRAVLPPLHKHSVTAPHIKKVGAFRRRDSTSQGTIARDGNRRTRAAVTDHDKARADVFVIDITWGLSNNPALLLPRYLSMTLRSSTCHILLLSADGEIQSHYKDLFGEQSITVGREGPSLQKDLSKRNYDAVIIESKLAAAADLGKLLTGIDPSRTLLLIGSRTVLKRTASVLQASKASRDVPQPNGKGQSLCLDSYLEHKVGDFVKGMRNGSGKNLHPMLIAAVERPLILLTLRETKGNQIQAAELLGLNRNTLRKKILDLDIPVKRARAS